MLSRGHFHAVLQAMPVPAVILSARSPFIVVEASDSWLALMGLRRECVLGKEFASVFRDGENNPTFRELSDGIAIVICEKRTRQFPSRPFHLATDGGCHNRRTLAICGEHIPILDENGEVSLLIHKVHDIKGHDDSFHEQVRKHANAALALRIQMLMDETHDPLVLTDDGGKFVEVNAACKKLLGYQSVEPRAWAWPDVVVGWEHKSQNCPFKGYITGSFDLRKMDGTIIHCQFNTWKNIMDGRHITVIADISEKHRLKELAAEAERQFRNEQQRFSDLFREAPVSMCILKGENHVFEKVNALYESLIPGKSVIGRPARECFPELEGHIFFEMLDHVYRTGQTFSSKEMKVEYYCEQLGNMKDLYLNFMFQPFRNHQGEVEGIFYFGIDINEQVYARKKIEESERRYRQIFETAEEGIWLMDRDQQTVFLNKKMGDILGYQPDEMVGKCLSDFLDVADGNEVRGILGQTTNNGARSFEMPLVSRAGKRIWTFLNTNRILDENGDYNGLLAMVTDITERKIVEEELKKLSLIARSTTNGIIITNPDYKIEWVNDAFTRITGFTFQDVAGKTGAVLYGTDTDIETQRAIDGCMKRQEPFACEMIKYKKSGDPFWVEIQGRPVFGDDGNLNYYFNMETDITERKKAFQKLVKQENQIRIFAGQLNHVLEDERARIAREIHDEFGQQLMGLKMSLSSLENISNLSKDGRDFIRDVMTGLESSFHSLRDLSNELRPGILDTLGLVPSIEWLARGFEKRSGIPCVVSMHVEQQMFGKDLSINFFRICQEALTNIARHSGATEVAIEMEQSCGVLHLSICDNGRGIMKEKVDNPFSLGLLGMHERARLIGAEFEICSKPGEGTCIQLKSKVYEG
jgi:PAS domain S-box-containing protein